MKRTGFLALGLGCVVCLGIVAGSSTRARAGDNIDCSKVEKWVDRSSHYDKGALVTHRSGFHYHEFKCNSGSCANEPTRSSEWQDQGECKSGTEPR
jgi:hypothetical protein